MSDEPHNPSASDQLREEIHAAILRSGRESEITVYQVIGVLEVVKADLLKSFSQGTK